MRRGAVLTTAVGAIVLMGWGTALCPTGQARGPVAMSPAVITVHEAVLNPATGAVIWSTGISPTRVVVDPLSGVTVSPAAPSLPKSGDCLWPPRDWARSPAGVQG
jgi:hypothetical protein